MKKKIENVENDAFIREVSEDVKNDQLKEIWKKYGLWIVLGVAAILTIAVSWETIKAKRIEKSAELTETFAYAVSLQNQGKYDQALAIYERIEKDGHEIYGDVAKLQISNIYFEQGKVVEGVRLLEEIVNNKKVNKDLHEMSAIKLATYKLDVAPKEEVLALLTPIATSQSSWANIAKEMSAMLYIREGDLVQARAMYQSILDSADADEDLRARVKDMLSTLGAE